MVYQDSDSFFEWFLGEIEKYVPNYKELVITAPEASRQGISNHSKIVQALPTLDSVQITDMFAEIRNIISIPEDFYLVYDKNIETYASRYNTTKRRLEIICPTYAHYHLRYPPVIKAAMQHEMGHLLNKDYAVNTKGHTTCANQCMDIRINHHIDRDYLRDLFDGVYYFRAKKFTMLVPEETLEEYGLYPKKYGTYSYEQIHKYYHLNDEDPKPKKPKPIKVYNMPEIGDVVMINKSSDYGMVTDIVDGKAVVRKMNIEEVKEHFEMGSSAVKDTLEDMGYSGMD